MSMNPFFEPSTLPYQLPPFAEIREEHYAPALERAMAEHLEEIAAIAADPAGPTFSNTIVALELAGQLLRRVLLAFQNQADSDTTPGLQALQARFNPRMAEHWDAIRLNAALFARVRAVYEDRAAVKSLRIGKEGECARGQGHGGMGGTEGVGGAAG